MAYATVDDVNDYATHLAISATTSPTATEVTAMIATVETVLDQKLRAVGIAVPVTDADSLQVVKQISLYGTLAAVYRSMDMEPDREERFQRLHDEALSEIMKRPAILQVADTDGVMPGTGGARSGDPPFERGGANW